VSGAILAWGLDLGTEGSLKADLFENAPKAAQELDWGSWNLVYYGCDGGCLALTLGRSETTRFSDVGADMDVADFFKVTLGGEGYPIIASQPTEEEVETLLAIVGAVRPDTGTVELVLQPLLLPLDD
jgi:hypothetical protein